MDIGMQAALDLRG